MFGFSCVYHYQSSSSPVISYAAVLTVIRVVTQRFWGESLRDDPVGDFIARWLSLSIFFVPSSPRSFAACSPNTPLSFTQATRFLAHNINIQYLGERSETFRFFSQILDAYTGGRGRETLRFLPHTVCVSENFSLSVETNRFASFSQIH